MPHSRLKAQLFISWAGFLALVLASPLALASRSRTHSARALTVTHSHFSCSGDPPLRSSRPRPGDNGFRIRIEGEPETYDPEREYVVNLQSTLPSYFRGFAVKAVNARDASVPAGRFVSTNPHISQTMSLCPNVITHVHTGKKTKVLIRWIAPSTGFGCVNISASVVQKGFIWFKDSGRLTVTLCERSSAAHASDTTECCACGSAMYRMTFYGLWSPRSHPRDYPPYSTHWSNVVGASHSPNYVIWEYGGYASDGVQKVAEWGWPNDVETEIRAQGDDVLSVLKTKAQWPAYEPRNIRSPPSDTFQVDADRPLVSLLTMLGPSPDWNVGIAKQSMCTEVCGWAGERTYNLTPWDAGTDSGVSYMSPNSPTIPHEKIRPLTTSDHPESPFYNPEGGDIPPVARVVIRRIALADDQCGESEPVPETVDVDVDESSVSAIDTTSCMYGEWSGWSACGVTCGWGIKKRNRMVKFRSGSAACEETMQKEICKGSEACERNSDVTACFYSDWTSWSQCIATCGQETKVRSRVLKWPSEETFCHEPLKEMSSCNLTPCSASSRCEYSSWSRWMPCSVSCGFGTTLRKRFLTYSPPDEACSEPLMQNSQCLTSMSCITDPGLDSSDCSYSPWTEWASCPVACGAGQSFRKRMLVRSTPGVTCEEVQMENTKCMTSASCMDADAQSNAAECTYTAWSEWMPCSVTCGVGTTLRKRFLAGSDAIGICEGFIMENADCHKPPCPTLRDSRNCHYLSWTRWMPCSTTCGVGETLRKRFLNESSSNEDCDPFEMEANKCMVSCDVTNTVQCMYADWSPWMPCSESCGGNGTTFRKRALKFAPDELTCEEVLMETKPCNSLPCAIGDGDSQPGTDTSCVTSSWQPWSECSNSCGRKGVTLRQRVRLDPSPSNACSESNLVQRRICRTENRCPRGSFSRARDCELGIWSSWKPACSNNQCLTKFQVRRRKVLLRRKGNGQRCGHKKERRRCRCVGL